MHDLYNKNKDYEKNSTCNIHSSNLHDYSYMFRPIETLHSPNLKRIKESHYIPELIVEIRDRNNNLIPIRALVDTGTTSTLL